MSYPHDELKKKKSKKNAFGSYKNIFFFIYELNENMKILHLNAN